MSDLQTTVSARPSRRYSTSCKVCGRAATYTGHDLPSLCALHETDRLRSRLLLSPKQLLVVQAKVKAELNDIPQRVIATEVFPNQTPHAAEVSMSNELKKPDVKEALQIALVRRGLTVDKVIGVVDDALIATKPNPKAPPETDPETGEKPPYNEEVPDHSIRLKAASMVSKFLGIDKSTDGTANFNFINMSQAQRDKYGL
jgi:hypothetical protein